jgi:hypothetical protein
VKRRSKDAMLASQTQPGMKKVKSEESEKPARLTKQMLTFSFHLAGQAGEE